MIVGNANYPDADSPLKEPLKDARALADELRRDGIGFDVDVAENLWKEGMRKAFDRFYGKIKAGSVALVFFSGYAIQSGPRTGRCRHRTREAEMIIILLAVAAVAVLVPVVCLVLVSIASLREDGAHSLSYKPAGAIQAAARRMLGFHGDALTERPGAARSARTSGFAAWRVPRRPDLDREPGIHR